MSDSPDEKLPLSELRSGSHTNGKMVRVMIFPPARGTTG